jgi:hypothetical protein
LSAATKEGVTVDFQRRYDTARDAEKPDTNPGDKEPNSESVLRNVNVKEGLHENQKGSLLTLLLEYQDYFSKNPRKCNCFEYNFIVEGGVPIHGRAGRFHSRYTKYRLKLKKC